jgi:hypothetical protein
MDGWMDGRMDGCMDGWMDGWMDGRMDRQTDIAEKKNTYRTIVGKHIGEKKHFEYLHVVWMTS